MHREQYYAKGWVSYYHLPIVYLPLVAHFFFNLIVVGWGVAMAWESDEWVGRCKGYGGDLVQLSLSGYSGRARSGGPLESLGLGLELHGWYNGVAGLWGIIQCCCTFASPTSFLCVGLISALGQCFVFACFGLLELSRVGLTRPLLPFGAVTGLPLFSSF